MEDNYSDEQIKVKKQQFKEWAINRGQIKGVKESTIKVYINAFERMWRNSNLIDKKGTPYSYGSDDIEELQSLFSKFESNGDMADSDSKLGFNWYIDFLQEYKGDYKMEKHSKNDIMEKNERYEVNNDGAVVIGIPQIPADRKVMIEKLFNRFSWHYELLKEFDNVHYYIKLSNGNLNKEIKLHLFHGNIRREDPDRNRSEKKIQLGSGVDPRLIKDEICIILGLYVYENNDINDAIIVAWPVEQDKNYPINPSLRVNMEKEIMPAKNLGVYVDRISGKHLVAFRPEFIYYYLENYRKLHDYNDALDSVVTSSTDKIIRYNSYLSDSVRNRIIFGAPGTGKSYLLEQDRAELLKECNEDHYERVTFHPDYTYANFVGTYKPVMVMENSTSPVDNDTMSILSVLTDKSKTAQEKYDELFDKFKDGDLTRLPLLLGLYTDESFKTRKADGTPAANDNAVERNHGRSVRKYINLVDGNEKPKGISYEYVPGPFMRLYVKALKNAQTDNPQPYLLIIEEINRANVAAVFGDVFQLLDRDDDGVSQYSIQASEDIKKYLVKEMGGEPNDYSKIRIPNNMFIWATMNSADQGVFPMDTAFKRRWDFSYIGIDENDNDIRDKYVLLANRKQKVEWNKLRKAINDFLARNKINEDKQLGPYFIGRQIVVPKNNGKEIDSKKFTDAFKNKVIMYLFEDAAKQKRLSLFAGCQEKGNRYSDICKEFDEKGINIFADEIVAATGYESIDNPTEDDSTEN